jgi:hypothetical protein
MSCYTRVRGLRPELARKKAGIQWPDVEFSLNRGANQPKKKAITVDAGSL